MLLPFILQNLASTTPDPVVTADTHDYVPDFWFRQWDKKKKVPVLKEVVKFIEQEVSKPKAKQVEAQIAYADLDSLAAQIALAERIIQHYEEMQEEEELIMMMLH